MIDEDVTWQVDLRRFENVGMAICEWDSEVRQFIAVCRIVKNPKQIIGVCLYGLTREAALESLNTKQFKFIEWNNVSKENIGVKI